MCVECEGSIIRGWCKQRSAACRYFQEWRSFTWWCSVGVKQQNSFALKSGAFQASLGCIQWRTANTTAFSHEEHKSCFKCVRLAVLFLYGWIFSLVWWSILFVKKFTDFWSKQKEHPFFLGSSNLPSAISTVRYNASRPQVLAFHLVFWGREGGNRLSDRLSNSPVQSHFPIYASRGDFYSASKETVKNVIAFLADANSWHKAIWKPDVISKHTHTLKFICTHNHLHAQTHKQVLETHEKLAARQQHKQKQQGEVRQLTKTLSVPPKFSFVQQSITYLMPIEGKESSTKVWGKHEYSAWNLHTLISSSCGPFVHSSTGYRCNQLCK